MSLLPRKGLLAIAAVIDVALNARGQPVAAKALANSRRPVIYAGGGVVSANASSRISARVRRESLPASPNVRPKVSWAGRLLEARLFSPGRSATGKHASSSLSDLFQRHGVHAIPQASGLRAIVEHMAEV